MFVPHTPKPCPISIYHPLFAFSSSLQAARAVCALPNVSSRDLGPAITMLHMFLASPKPALRFAAVRTLHRLAGAHAAVVAKCNVSISKSCSYCQVQWREEQLLHGV